MLLHLITRSLNSREAWYTTSDPVQLRIMAMILLGCTGTRDMENAYVVLLPRT
jgi:hypothetical protein